MASMNTDDLLRRDIIQQLTCHFRLDTRALEQHWNIDFKQQFGSELERLETMAQDGLVRLEEDTIEVLAAGRLLVRNICMIFDRYQQLPGTQGRFSRTI